MLKTLERNALQAVFTGQGPLSGIPGTAPAANAGSNAVGSLAGSLAGRGGLFGSFGRALVQGPPQSGATLDAAGGFGGFLASIFRANGGPVSAGQPTTVGEMGRELFVPRVDGQIVPIARGGFGGPQSVDQSRSYTIDARGAQAGVAEQIAGALRAYDAGLNRTLGSRMDGYRKRIG